MRRFPWEKSGVRRQKSEVGGQESEERKALGSVWAKCRATCSRGRIRDGWGVSGVFGRSWSKSRRREGARELGGVAWAAGRVALSTGSDGT